MTKHTPPKPRALVDMDGTLADFDGAMRRDLLKLLGPDEVPRLTAKDEDDFPYVKERRRLIKSQTDWWFNLQPLALGMRTVLLMEKLGFKVTVLTRGPKPHPHAWAEKVRWVQQYLPGRRIIVMDDEKALVYGRVLMDDWVPYVEPWLKTRPRGIVIMPDQPWNQGFTHPRVFRLSEATESGVSSVLEDARDRKTEESDNED